VHVVLALFAEVHLIDVSGPVEALLTANRHDRATRDRVRPTQA
jgi:hypothetical protein